jgi:hypothetical protein
MAVSTEILLKISNKGLKLAQVPINLGSLMAAIILFLVGTILCVTAVILFSMATLMRERQ